MPSYIYRRGAAGAPPRPSQTIPCVPHTVRHAHAHAHVHVHAHAHVHVHVHAHVTCTHMLHVPLNYNFEGPRAPKAHLDTVLTKPVTSPGQAL